MKRPLLPLLLALAFLAAACSNVAPYATTVGVLQPGSVMHVRVTDAVVNAFAPEIGQPHDRFTVAATALRTGPQPAPPQMRPARDGVSVVAKDPLAYLLLRVPDGVGLVVDSGAGDVHVTNIGGNVDVRAAANVQIQVPGYAQALTQNGNVTVTMGALDWPGTLHFGTQRGDVLVYVNENARFVVRLHTDHGTLFSDFDLRGTHQGDSETIDSQVNGGAVRRIDVEVGTGTIRLLKLHPEA